MINLDDLTELEFAEVFSLVEQSKQPYEKDSITRTDITIEMNLDLRVIARDGYTFLDYVSDIGGLEGMLITAMAAFLSIWNHNNFNNYMVTRLYRSTGQEKSAIEATALQNLKEYSRTWIPSCCLRSRCCKPNRLQRTFINGRRMLGEELNIISLVKQMRELNEAMQILIPPAAR